MEENMKTFKSMFIGLLIASSVATAHAEKIVGGPKGGRLLEGDGMRAEFFVEKDHTVNITFYDETLKKVPATSQSATAIAEAPSGKQKLEFERKGDELVSKSSLPEGHGYNVVVQLKANETAKPKNFRIPFEMSLCGGCNRAEYACTCDEH
jgi:hypothetical protein